MLKLSTFLAVRSIELYYNMLCYKTTWVYLSSSSKVIGPQYLYSDELDSEAVNDYTATTGQRCYYQHIFRR